MGASTSFEVRGLRTGSRYFTSFYGYALTRGVGNTWRSRAWPRITRYDDRWAWLVTSVVPRFRRLDGDVQLIGTSLARISMEAIAYASRPCIPPLLS